MELKRLKQGLDDIHRMLGQIPRVNIQEVEGYGLRPNIGMGGTGVDQRSKITLMEKPVAARPRKILRIFHFSPTSTAARIGSMPHFRTRP